MKIKCPSCGLLITGGQMNVAGDVAVCVQCHEAFAISAIVAQGQQLEGFELDDPPGGAWFEDTGSGWRVGATTRSPAALLVVPFMCVWSGFSLGAIYGTQIAAGEFNLLTSLFGIPFALATLALGSIALMTVCGKLEVSADGDEGSVFEGVGPIGWRRRFSWLSVQSVEELAVGYHWSGSDVWVIGLVGKSRLKFGALVREARRYYVLQALRALLARRRC